MTALRQVRKTQEVNLNPGIHVLGSRTLSPKDRTLDAQGFFDCNTDDVVQLTITAAENCQLCDLRWVFVDDVGAFAQCFNVLSLGNYSTTTGLVSPLVNPMYKNLNDAQTYLRSFSIFIFGLNKKTRIIDIQLRILGFGFLSPLSCCCFWS